MATTFFAGSQGRMKLIGVAPSLSDAFVSFSGTTANVAGIRSWKVNVSVEQPPAVHFETSASTTGVLYEQQVQGGIGRWSAEVEGYFDGDTAASSAVFGMGEMVVCDFIYNKASGVGHKSANGKVTSFSPGGQVGGGLFTFTATIAGSGAFPDPS